MGLTAVTFNNGREGHNSKHPGVFESSVEDVVVLGSGILEWKNAMKINLLWEFLASVSTEHVLVSDSSDVVLIGDANKLIPWLESSGRSAIFNAEKKQWPTNLPTNIGEFELSISQTSYPHLNAGLWLAKTEFAKELVGFCRRMIGISGSEQYYYKHAYPTFFPAMVIDDSCEMFQNLNRVGDDELSVPYFF